MRYKAIARGLLAAGATIVVLVAWITLSLSNQEQSAQIAQLASNNDALRDQVQARGEVPVAPPAETVTGEPARDGVDGRDGQDGRPPTATEVLAAVATYCELRISCVGQPGADSAVPGPPGESIKGDPGADGAAGRDGTDGQPGTDGAAGPPGADGQPPLSWTFTDARGFTQACARTDPFDPTAPTYSCTTEGVTP